MRAWNRIKPPRIRPRTTNPKNKRYCRHVGQLLEVPYEKQTAAERIKLVYFFDQVRSRTNLNYVDQIRQDAKRAAVAMFKEFGV